MRAGPAQVIACIAVCTLVACHGENPPPARAGKSPAGFQVALLTPGPISDQSWNGGAYAGLLRIRDSLNASISHIQTRTPAEFEENFRQYGAKGYNVVIGHGFEFQDAAEAVAPRFPATTFVVTSGSRGSGNVVALGFAFEEASYLAGIVAARASRTHVIGAIGGTELPPVRRSFEAFAAGARSVDPRIRVVIAYIGNWDDISAGREQALAQISQGVDVIFQNADAAGLGVFQAARDNRARRVRVIGSNADQNAIAPDVTLGSVVIDLPHAFLLVVRRIQAGERPSGVVALGTASNVVRWQPNPAIAAEIPADVTRIVDSVRAQMLAGHNPVPGGA